MIFPLCQSDLISNPYRYIIFEVNNNRNSMGNSCENCGSKLDLDAQFIINRLQFL